jgi:hypothetical protein
MNPFQTRKAVTAFTLIDLLAACLSFSSTTEPTLLPLGRCEQPEPQ